MDNPTNQKTLSVRTEQDVIIARRLGRDLAAALGFSAVDQARITTAISELARNMVFYGKGGDVTIASVINSKKMPGIEVRLDDAGPGIVDIELAMTQGYTTGKGLGAGLPGSRRLMDEFELQSTPGQGVHIVMRKWR